MTVLIDLPWWFIPAQIAAAIAVGISTGLLVRWLLARQYRK
jgi:hypothetical protein